MIEQHNVIDIIGIALKAGEIILNVYEGDDFGIERKEDYSPLTIADKQSHDLIISELEKIDPHTPIISEEGNHELYEKRKGWKTFWLVDPLDGTKEFIKRNGEFTVNIALIENGVPVFGVIYAPVLDHIYVGSKSSGAYKLDDASQKTKQMRTTSDWLTAAQKLPLATKNRPFTVIASRSHRSKETENYMNQLEKQHGEIVAISAGSSLKLCLVAEGTADVYPRFAPTMEWDTAAGHAIVLGAGGSVVRADTSEPLTYNKESLLNPSFIAKL